MTFVVFVDTYFNSMIKLLEYFRISLCRKARSLLEEIVAKSDHPSSCKDLLALAYFFLGCCDQKAKFFKYSNSDIEVVRRTENDFEAKDSRNSDKDVSFYNM